MTSRSPLWTLLLVVFVVTAMLFAPLGCDKDKPAADGDTPAVDDVPADEHPADDAEHPTGGDHPAGDHPSGD